MGASLVPGNMIFSDNTTAFIDENPAPDTEHFNFMLENTGINKNAASDTEFCFFIHKTRRNHADTISLVSDHNGMSGIRTYTAAGDNYGFILVGNMATTLPFPSPQKIHQR